MHFKIAKIDYNKLIENRDIVTSIVLFRKYGNRIQLLIEKRAIPPKVDSYCIPGGHVGKNEDFREACVRELKEETNVTFNKDNLVYLGHSEREKNKNKLDYIYAGIYKGNVKLIASDDAATAEWCDCDALPMLIFDQIHYVRKAYRHFFGVEMPEKLNRGVLIVFEGLDGSGKSYLTETLNQYLSNHKLDVVMSNWNSGPITSKAIKKLKNSIQKTPELYSLLHAADMQERYDSEIRPALDEGKIVICDRYYYTSLARDAARNAELQKLSYLYGKFRKPDLIFHCYAPIKTCIERARFKGISYYSAGMDAHKHEHQEKNLLHYCKLINKFYHEILPSEDNYHKINTSLSEEISQEKVCKIADEIINFKKYKELELKLNIR